MGLLAPRRRLLFLLSEEMKGYLPQLEPYSSDYQLMVYASRDLEDWLKCKWERSSREVQEELEAALDNNFEAFKAFLNFWAGLWLEKWRERVKVLSTRPKLPPDVLKRIKKAKRVYRQMPHGRELKKMLVWKLISQGEICMPGFIAERLIIEEIAKRSRGSQEPFKFPETFALDLFNALSHRISRLPKEKGPLIYLNIKLRML